ncbi:MAG: histidine kinase [Flavobacteriales bacterium]|nr:histidine kinase [Flavobacteriales bacterium]
MPIKITLIICLTLWHIMSILGQTAPSKGQFNIQNWGVESELATNSIRGLAQTNEGFLLVGTLEGLFLFDGLSFNKVQSDIIDENEMILKVYSESSGRIWIVSTTGLYCYFNSEFKEQLDYPSTDMNVRFAEDYHHEVVLFMNQNALFFHNGQLQKEEIWENYTFYHHPFYYKNQLIIACDGKFEAFDKQALPRELATASFKHFRSAPEGNCIISGDNVLQITGDSILTPGFSVPYGMFDRDNVMLSNNGFLYSANAKMDSLILVNAEQSFCITPDDGLIPPRLNAAISISDNEHWIGTETGGLFHLTKSIFKITTSHDGLINEVISAVHLSDDSTLWIGYNCGGISQLKNGQILPNTYRGNGCVKSILVDSKNRTWVGSFNSGITLIEDNGDQHHYLKSVGINVIYETTDGELILGTDQGLLQFEKGAFSQKYEALRELVVSAIYENENGNFIVGTKQGIWEIRDHQPICLPSSRELKIRCIRPSQITEAFWVGTSSGLYYLNGTSLTALPSSKGLLAEKVNGIEIDQQENIWLSSNRGLYRCNEQDLLYFMDGEQDFILSSYFDKSDGLKTVQFTGQTQNSSLTFYNKDLLFTSVEGLVQFNPNNFIVGKSANPKITMIRVDDVGNLGSINLDLEYDQHQIVIHYTVPSFHHPEHRQFQYQLKGYDENWVYAGNVREAHYANLLPGTYHFMVKCDGSDQLAEIQITINPRYWQTMWFKVLIIVFTILVFMLIVYFIDRRRKIKLNRQLEIKKRMATLEMQALQSQLNPHFVFNCLNSIQYLFLEQDERGANKYLITFSLLMRKLLEYSDLPFISLKEELELLENYISLENLQFDPHFDYQLKIDASVDQDSLLVPTFLLQPIVENAIKHGLDRSEGNGVLAISLNQTPTHLEISVEDNGVGIEHTLKSKPNPSFGRTSKGRELVNNRIDLLKNNYRFSISINYLDKLKVGEASGTLVKINFPIRTKNE